MMKIVQKSSDRPVAEKPFCPLPPVFPLVLVLEFEFYFMIFLYVRLSKYIKTSTC